MTWEDATIATRTDWADGIWSITLDKPTPADFVPGQFVHLGFRVDGELTRRAYSLASAPGQPVELYLVRVEGGALTPWLFERGVGEVVPVDLRGNGFFTLDHVPPAAELWMLATGTGLAPFLSMLRHAQLWSRFESVVVVHGVRHASHLGYRDEFETLARARPLRYAPMVTREQRDDMLTGRIPARIEDGQLEDNIGLRLDPERSHVLLCGNPEMIADSLAALDARGLRRHRVRKPGHVTIEKYW